MNNRTLAILAIAAVAGLLIATATIATDNAFATRKKTQTTAQANDCGNGPLPLAIFCQTLSNQIQGNDNAVNMIGQQP
jgi:hypothetical protein